jgi:hypothetical protein
MLIIQNSEMRQICTFVKKNCLSFIKWGQKIPECDFCPILTFKNAKQVKKRRENFFQL